MTRALLIDLDGIIYEGEDLVPGARDTIAWIKDRRIPRIFLTNTTSRPRSALVDRNADLSAGISPHALLESIADLPAWWDARRSG